MKRKGIFALIACMAISFSGFGFNAFAEESNSQPLPDFSDNFDSYDIGKIEDLDAFKSNWDNDYFGGAMETASQQANVGTIEYENGTDGNKVLHVKNIENEGSFFYISAGHGSRYRNFNVTFRAKVTDAKNEVGGWFGINCRKEEDTRYTITNGMLLTHRWVEGSTKISPATYRYMPGAQVIILPDDLPKYATYTTYEEYEAGENVADWQNYKFCVSDSSYKLYINDVLVSDFTCDRTALDIFGYVSFCVCVSDVMIDDFVLENLDEVAPPVDEEIEEEPINPEVNNKESQKDSSTSSSVSKKKGCKGSVSSLGLTCLTAVLATAVIRRKNEKNS